MTRTPSLVTFSIRALVLLLPAAVLWTFAAESYNDALAVAAQMLLPEGVQLKVLGSFILVEHSPSLVPTSINGLTLHYGMILVMVLLLAANGIGVAPRLAWLGGMLGGLFLMQVLGVAMLARGLSWAYSGTASEGSSTLGVCPRIRSWRRKPPRNNLLTVIWTLSWSN